MLDNNLITAIHDSGEHLMMHAIKFTNDEDDAKDLVQDTLMKGIRFADKFEEGTNIRAWLYVIMRNTYINNFRKIVKKNKIIDVEENLESSHLLKSSTKNAGDTNVALEDIGKAMNLLKDQHRIAFQRYFEGYKYEEIAAEMNIPIGTVKTHIFQARMHLKEYLKMYK